MIYTSNEKLVRANHVSFNLKMINKKSFFCFSNLLGGLILGVTQYRPKDFPERNKV